MGQEALAFQLEVLRGIIIRGIIARVVLRTRDIRGPLLLELPVQLTDQAVQHPAIAGAEQQEESGADGRADNVSDAG